MAQASLLLREYTVEKIMFHYDFPISDSQEKLRKYFVKWDGFSVDESTWESENLPKEVVDKYERNPLPLPSDLIEEFEFTNKESEESPPFPEILPSEVIRSKIRKPVVHLPEQLYYRVKFSEINGIKIWEPYDEDEEYNVCEDVILAFENEERKKRKLQQKELKDEDYQLPLFPFITLEDEMDFETEKRIEKVIESNKELDRTLLYRKKNYVCCSCCGKKRKRKHSSSSSEFEPKKKKRKKGKKKKGRKKKRNRDLEASSSSSPTTRILPPPRNRKRKSAARDDDNGTFEILEVRVEKDRTNRMAFVCLEKGVKKFQWLGDIRHKHPQTLIDTLHRLSLGEAHKSQTRFSFQKQ